MKSGRISAIGRHRFELDGKGVRTLIVFSGCPLKCKYCINPYTWKEPNNNKTYTAVDLLDKVSVDGIYFEATNGGITFGGGEPLLQAEFISDFIDIAPRTWNYNVETSLAVPFDNVQMLANKVSKFVVDIKSLNEDTYYAYTGVSLSLAWDNLLKLKELIDVSKIQVRVPLIPGYADAESQNRTVQELRRQGFEDIDVFTYKAKAM